MKNAMYFVHYRYKDELSGGVIARSIALFCESDEEALKAAKEIRDDHASISRDGKCEATLFRVADSLCWTL